MANDFPNTRKFITRYANQVEQEIENRLFNLGKVASGELYDSIGYTITDTGKRIKLTFKMADYGKYVDKGTKPSKYADSTGKGSGKSEFIKSLMKWCQIKGLPKGAAFPIRRKIWKTGLPATNFFTIPTTRRKKYFEREYERNMALDVELAVEKELKGKIKTRKR